MVDGRSMRKRRAMPRPARQHPCKAQLPMIPHYQRPPTVALGGQQQPHDYPLACPVSASNRHTIRLGSVWSIQKAGRKERAKNRMVAIPPPPRQKRMTCRRELTQARSLNPSARTSNAYAPPSRPPSPSPTLPRKLRNDTMYPRLKPPARPKCC